MENSDTIRRAMRQTERYELPPGFTPRLMTRIRKRKRRREIRETLAYLLGGVACFTALIAGGVWAWMEYGEPNPHTGAQYEMPSLPELQLPELQLPDMGAAFTHQNRIWLFMIAGFVMLSICDILLRHRFRPSDTGK